MHSKDATQATTQAPGTVPGAAGPETDKPVLQKAVDQVTEMAALSWSVSERYAEQIKLSGQTAKAELKLTGRSLTIAAGLIVCLGAGLILLWFSLLLVLGYLIFHYSGSLMLSAAVLLMMQFAVLYWCWRSLDYVLSQVGFSETWRQLKRLLLKAEGASNAD